ncbi:hypothetical protein [Mycobacterium sp. DL440]|nr:hypothetical protein [Mycobacterium sp. DL440]
MFSDLVLTHIVGYRTVNCRLPRFAKLAVRQSLSVEWFGLAVRVFAAGH